MCYTRKHRGELEREDPKVIQSRLMEEEARYRQEEHDRRRMGKEEQKPLIEKVKAVAGVR